MTDDLKALAEAYAAKYDGDDRQDIKSDIFNAFCAGIRALLPRIEQGAIDVVNMNLALGELRQMVMQLQADYLEEKQGRGPK